VVKLCSEWGLRWQGKPIEKQNWVHIQSIMPFANDGPISTAIGDIKMLFPGIDTLSVVGKVCKAVTSFLKGGFHIDEFQEIRPTTFGMRFAMDCLYHSLLFGDLEKKQIHGNFLTGERVSDIGSIQQALRKLQALDAIWKHYRASPAFSPEVGKQLWEKFESLPVFVKWAAADDFWQKNPAHGFLNGQKGIHYWTAQKFGKLCEDLPSPAAVALAELLHGTLTTSFDLVFLAHTTDHADGGASDYDSLLQLLRGANGDPLGSAFKKYTNTLASQAVPLEDQPLAADGLSQPLAAAQSFTAVFGIADEDEEAVKSNEEKKQLFDKIKADKQASIRFHSLPHLPAGPIANYMNGTEMNRILASCPFHAAAAKKLAANEKVTTRAWVMSVDLFPGCMTGGAKDFRLTAEHFLSKPCPESLKSVWKWVNSVRKPDDVVIILDGRYSQIRRYFDAEMSGLNAKYLMDMWIIYKTPEAEGDVRYQKRKMVFSNCNREVILVYRPVGKRKSTVSTRTAFNACGERSSFDLTYTMVQLRSLGELPKLTTTDKKKMLGAELDVPLAYPGEQDKSLAVDGVPFSWAESKPVGWWAVFFKELGIDHVFDLFAGSAGAAIGAHYTNVQYDGICCNPLHKNWCEKLMDQALFAIIADGGGGANPEFVKKIMHFFGPSVDEGMRMLKVAQKNASKDTPKKAEKEDEDDDDDEGDDEDEGEEEDDEE
jgi:hypothetical protein